MEVGVEQKSQLDKLYKIDRGNETIYMRSPNMEITKIQQLRTNLVVEMMKEYLPTEIILIILSCVKYKGNYIDYKYGWAGTERCCAWWKQLKESVRPNNPSLIFSRVYDTRWRYDLTQKPVLIRDNKMYRMVIQIVKVNKITMRYNFQIQEHSGKVSGKWIGVKRENNGGFFGGYYLFLQSLPPYTFPTDEIFFPNSTYYYNSKHDCYEIKRDSVDHGGYAWDYSIARMMNAWRNNWGCDDDTFYIDYGV